MGINIKIRFNAFKGIKIKTNTTNTFMHGVEQNADGGEITHTAKNTLVQESNEMTATNKGEIINEVDKDGSLIQKDNIMKADNKGKIINRIKKNKSFLYGLIFAIIGVIADLLTLYTTGKNIWEFL